MPPSFRRCQAMAHIVLVSRAHTFRARYMALISCNRRRLTMRAILVAISSASRIFDAMTEQLTLFQISARKPMAIYGTTDVSPTTPPLKESEQKTRQKYACNFATCLSIHARMRVVEDIYYLFQKTGNIQADDATCAMMTTSGFPSLSGTVTPPHQHIRPTLSTLFSFSLPGDATKESAGSKALLSLKPRCRARQESYIDERACFIYFIDAP